MSGASEITIPESDCEVTFLIASGPGGQHRNKRETGVRLRHIPTGIVVMATERRSQSQNLAVAFERLARKIQILNRPKKTRKPTKPKKSAVEKRLKAKKAISQIKALRKCREEI